MFGLILWLIIIFLITVIMDPSFLLVMLVSFIAFGIMAFLYYWIKDLIIKFFNKQEANNPTSFDREKAIKEWEKKWKRPHPSKTINRKTP